MTQQTTSLSSQAAGSSAAPSDVATQLEQSLSQLVWHVLYGKFHDAASLAVGAEQMLGRLRAGKAA